MSVVGKENEGRSAFIAYDCERQKVINGRSVADMLGVVFDEDRMFEELEEKNIMTKESIYHIKQILKNMPARGNDCVYSIREKITNNGLEEEYAIVFVYEYEKNTVLMTFDKTDSFQNYEGIDVLTYLLNRESFLKKLQKSIKKDETDKLRFVAYFDVQRFKTINDMFGNGVGDELLMHIAYCLDESLNDEGYACRVDSDRFVFFYSGDKDKEINQIIKELLTEIRQFNMPFEIVCNVGVYIIEGDGVSADSAMDRAIMAQSKIKGSYIELYNIYKEDLRQDLISEQEITGMMNIALKQEQFIVYYQPQYNHSTKKIVGAEALVRWVHPEKGIISPARFIPVFEKNGFISNLDLYVFERACQFVRYCMDNGISVVPVSTNLTRYDIFLPNFIEQLEKIKNKYNIPSKYLRVEITESVAIGNSKFINDAVAKLHDYGFIVEMDDFGSGYSSLNILKDIDFDIIKLDMRFLQNSEQTQEKGGTILSSVVRMINWLKLPIIAEGVEEIRQADFLKSIGCEYIQGYLYSKPLPKEEFIELLKKTDVSDWTPQLEVINSFSTGQFWSSESLETLIFSNFVGGAAIINYNGDTAEIIRINKKYLLEFNMNMKDADIINKDVFESLDEEGKQIFKNALDEAARTKDEEECETWQTIKTECCGEDRICIRSNIQLIGQTKEEKLYYVMVRNITKEKQKYLAVLDNEKRFKAASEQANIYFWEYNVDTKEMRPCFRCMRDLGLPAVLTNYPESAIEMGVFPEEVADMYRDWHKQIENGVESLEAVMPLTAGKIPFHVRYTTEFDENGKAVKAYGSATLVVENN